MKTGLGVNPQHERYLKSRNCNILLLIQEGVTIKWTHEERQEDTVRLSQPTKVLPLEVFESN